MGFIISALLLSELVGLAAAACTESYSPAPNTGDDRSSAVRWSCEKKGITSNCELGGGKCEGNLCCILKPLKCPDGWKKAPEDKHPTCNSEKDSGECANQKGKCSLSEGCCLQEETCTDGWKKAEDQTKFSCTGGAPAGGGTQCENSKGKCVKDGVCCVKEDQPTEPKKDDANPCPAGKNPYRDAGKSSCMPDANGKTECVDNGGTCDNDKKATGPKPGECCSCCK